MEIKITNSQIKAICGQSHNIKAYRGDREITKIGKTVRIYLSDITLGEAIYYITIKGMLELHIKSNSDFFLGNGFTLKYKSNSRESTGYGGNIEEVEELFYGA